MITLVNAHPSGRRWRIAGYAGSAIAAAGLTFLVRRSLDHPAGQVAFHQAAGTISTVSVHREKALPDPATLDDSALVGFMDAHPAEMMNFIDRLVDRDLALKLTGRLIAEIQGPHFELLTAWAKRQQDQAVTAALLTGMPARWVREDPQDCIALACGLGEGEMAEKARETVFLALTAEQCLEMLNRLSPE